MYARFTAGLELREIKVLRNSRHDPPLLALRCIIVAPSHEVPVIVHKDVAQDPHRRSWVKEGGV